MPAGTLSVSLEYADGELAPRCTATDTSQSVISQCDITLSGWTVRPPRCRKQGSTIQPPSGRINVIPIRYIADSDAQGAAFLIAELSIAARAANVHGGPS